MLKKLTLAFLMPLSLLATDFNPFFGPQLFIDAKADYLYQNFTKVKKNHQKKDYHSNDHFLHLSGSIPYDVYSGELELTGAATRHRTFGFDDLRLTGRFQILADCIDDSQSLVIGATAIQAIKQSVHDIGSFHHGKIEGLLHASFGKEFTCQQFWTERYWGMLGLGSADVGSPWLQGMLVWDRNLWDTHQFRLFAKGLYGFGGNTLRIRHFKGYGPIAHRSIDIGARYDYTLYWYGTWGIEYAYRVYARNFPCQTNLLQFHFEIPLGTGI